MATGRRLRGNYGPADDPRAFAEAIEGRVSDIHIEPFEKAIKVKYRVDGILHETSPPPKRLQQAIVSRIKIMAGMNIAQRFLPQDGHITIDGPRGKVDTFPSARDCESGRTSHRTAASILRSTSNCHARQRASRCSATPSSIGEKPLLT